MNKKTLGSFLLAAALLVGGTVSTFAYFTNSATSEVVSFTTGNVKVDFNKAAETPWSLYKWPIVDRDGKAIMYNAQFDGSDHQNAKNLAPGDRINKSFTIKNVGSLDAKVRLSLAGPSNPIAGYTDFYAYAGKNYEFKAYKIMADGTEVPVSLQTVTPVEGTSLAGAVPYAILDAKTQETLRVDVIVIIDPKMGNGELTLSQTNWDGSISPTTYANFDKTFAFTVKAESTQWNNPTFNESGN